MGNDVRVLFKKINQVDLPYQVFDIEEEAALSAPVRVAKAASAPSLCDADILAAAAKPASRTDAVFKGVALPANEPTMAKAPAAPTSGLLRKYGERPATAPTASSAAQGGRTLLSDIFANLARR